jgi:hypothetical protein
MLRVMIYLTQSIVNNLPLENTLLRGDIDKKNDTQVGIHEEGMKESIEQESD